MENVGSEQQDSNRWNLTAVIFKFVSVKRVRQHIIEEESRKAFSRIVPSEWVMNDFTKDYGKDIHVEIFKNEVSTGKTFIVQLKGSDQVINDNTFNIQIKTDTLHYFKSLSTPVLLVFYSTTENQFWGIWANGLIDFYNVKEDQKTVTINLNKGYHIDKNYFDHLEEKYDEHLPFKINLTFSGAGPLRPVLQKRICLWLDKHFPNGYLIDDGTLPDKMGFIADENAEHLLLSFSDNDDVFPLQPLDKKKEIGFLYRPVVDENQIDAAEAEILFILTVAFIKFNPPAGLRLLSLVLPLYKGKYKTREQLLFVAGIALNAHCIHEMQALIRVTIDHQLVEEFQVLNMALFGRPHFEELYQRNLEEAVAVFHDERVLASLYYNLGNYCRHYSEFDRAAMYYLKARKLDPAYLERFYWWHEFAGILFLLDHPKIAQMCYERAMQLDSEKQYHTIGHALLADCYFNQAKFSEAAAHYDLHLKAVVGLNKTISGYYAFKHGMCQNMIDGGHDDMIIDRQRSEAVFREALKENNEDKYEAVLQLNPLHCGAWFTLGRKWLIEKEYASAFSAFLNAALILETHRESWVYCMFACVNLQRPDLSLTILSIIIEKLGADVMNEFSEVVFNNPDIALEDKEELMESIKETVRHLKEKIVDDIYLPHHYTARVIPHKQMNEEEQAGKK